MMLNRYRYSTLAFCFTLSLSIPVAPLANAETSQWRVGGGVAVVNNAYRGIDNKITPLPFLAYENKWIRFSVPEMDLKFASLDSVTLSLRVKYISDGYDADDSYYLTGMDDRKSSFWVGGAMTWKTDFVDLSAEILGDTSDYSNGYRSKFQAEKRFAYGDFGFTPKFAVEWVDGNFVDYYYGIKKTEEKIGRSTYKGNSTTNFKVGMRMDHTLYVRHTIFLDASFAIFGNAIKDSPLVDKSTESSVGIGYIYNF